MMANCLVARYAVGPYPTLLSRVKLVITAFSTVILMMYMGTFRQMAGVAADPVVELGLVRNPSPLLHNPCVGIAPPATVLAIYKPFGMTPCGMRQQLHGTARMLTVPIEQVELVPIWIHDSHVAQPREVLVPVPALECPSAGIPKTKHRRVKRLEWT
jgi:hypothetical protein